VGARAGRSFALPSRVAAYFPLLQKGSITYKSTAQFRPIPKGLYH
jgi:hypothetical protein